MLEIALHTGTEHPELLWIALSSFLTFVSGMALGARSGKVRELFETESAESSN